MNYTPEVRFNPIFEFCYPLIGKSLSLLKKHKRLDLAEKIMVKCWPKMLYCKVHGIWFRLDDPILPEWAKNDVWDWFYYPLKNHPFKGIK